jgi:hypothetical protein
MLSWLAEKMIARNMKAIRAGDIKAKARIGHDLQ